MHETASLELELSLRTELAFQEDLLQILGKISDEEIKEINNIVLDFKIRKILDMHRIENELSTKIELEIITDLSPGLTQLAVTLMHTQTSTNKMPIKAMNIRMNIRLSIKISIKTNIKINTGGTL